MLKNFKFLTDLIGLPIEWYLEYLTLTIIGYLNL